MQHHKSFNYGSQCHISSVSDLKDSQQRKAVGQQIAFLTDQKCKV